jgi:hypothetical protein
LAVVATLTKGYDLDYIWKQVDQGPAEDAAGYYIQASEGGGEPPGRWRGPGAEALGFEPGQLVEREPYDLLFGERKAPDRTQLGRPPGGGRKAADIYAGLLAVEPHAIAERKRELRLEAARQARLSPLYFDLTLSLSKSISIFHASLGGNARLARQAGDAAGYEYWAGLVGEVDAMIWQAVHAGFGYFQRGAGYTRTGSHNKRVNGQETGQWRESDLAVAHWLQHTSRDGDMQLHVHSQIAHVARIAIDGKRRAPDSLGYNEHIGAVGAITAQHGQWPYPCGSHTRTYNFVVMAEPGDRSKQQKRDEPESQNSDRWSEADYRLMWITFGATLAANITTVLFIAFAIIIIRGKLPGWEVTLTSSLITFVAIGFLSSRWWRRVHVPSNFNIRVIIACALAFGIYGLFFLVAKASNVK